MSNAFVEKIRTEPVLVTALVQTALTLVAAFGLDLTAEQVAGIIAFTGAILAFVARAKVTSVRALETGELTEVAAEVGLVAVAVLLGDGGEVRRIAARERAGGALQPHHPREELGRDANLRPEQPRQVLPVEVTRMDGTVFTFKVLARVDAPIEWEYYRHGGILPMVLRKLASE